MLAHTVPPPSLLISKDTGRTEQARCRNSGCSATVPSVPYGLIVGGTLYKKKHMIYISGIRMSAYWSVVTSHQRQSDMQLSAPAIPTHALHRNTSQPSHLLLGRPYLMSSVFLLVRFKSTSQVSISASEEFAWCWIVPSNSNMRMWMSVLAISTGNGNLMWGKPNSWML